MNERSESNQTRSLRAEQKDSPTRASGPGSGSATLLHCSYCGQSYSRKDSDWLPFCSKRCQLIDLGNWLDESYGLPYEGEAELNDDD